MDRDRIAAVLRAMAVVCATGIVFGATGAATLAQTPGGLARRGLVGTKLRAASEEVRKTNKLDDAAAIEIEAVLPETAAESAGLKAGDLITAVNGAKVTAPSEFIRAIRGKKAGETIEVQLIRTGESLTKDVVLKPAPFESSTEFDVVYDSVKSGSGRLRTILTKPKGDGKHAALFLIQGIGTFSVDNPAGGLASYKIMADAFTKQGFVTLRVDKPGCGDSEGGPADEVDFDTELDGYRQALKALMADPSVDADKVFVFGHSMGGVMAPLLATEIPVRGIAVYGTVSKTWTEYMLENIRRQAELAGTDPGEIDQKQRLDSAIQHYLNNEGMSPQAIAKKYPDLKARIKEYSPDGRTFVGRSYKFFQQLAGKNLGQAWAACPADVLSVWGAADFVSARDDHERIANFVNRAHSGHATFVVLEGSDHGFTRATSQAESQSRQTDGEFNPAFVEMFQAWVAKRTANSQ
jgi:alpha-beta hydrolase superfamily lysophospholipase